MSSFPILSDHDYLNFVGAIRHRGANESTHVAEVRYPVQRAGVTSVVKLMRPDGIGLCNEAIAWLFLRAIGLPVPQHAGILIMTEKKAKAVLGRSAVPTELVSGGYVLAWASQQLAFSSIRALFSGCEGDAKWLDVLRTDTGAAIAAFDELFHNIDRNLGNVLFHGKGSCIPIDHEQIFAVQNWIAGEIQQLAGNGDSLRAINRAHTGKKLSTSDWTRVRDTMVACSQHHKGALDVCRVQVLELLTTLFKGAGSIYANRILSFVDLRCQDNWMQQRVGALT